MSATKDNSNLKKDDFEKMLALAEFSAERMEQRRTVEFRIFISYMTLLVLALYQLLKQNPIRWESLIFELFKQNPSPISIYEVIVLYVIALLIHFVYVMWQVGVGRAMKNDAIRRNFYLRKAESISRRIPKYCDKNTNPDDKIIPIKNYFQQFKHISIIYTDWSRMLLVAIPTSLFIIVVDLFLQKTSSDSVTILQIEINADFVCIGHWVLFLVLIISSAIQYFCKIKKPAKPV